MRRPYIAVVAFQRPRLHRLKPDVQIQQLPAHPGPGPKVVVQGQARKLPQQVNPVVVAIHRVVQHGVGDVDLRYERDFLKLSAYLLAELKLTNLFQSIAPDWSQNLWENSIDIRLRTAA